MTFLSYWDIFGVVLIALYFILSWLYPKRTQQKPEANAEKEEYSRTHARENLKAARDTDGLSSEAFIHRKSDKPEFVLNTSRSSLNGDAQAESTPQEVNTSSCKIDSSSVENTEKIQSSLLVSDLDLPSYETTIASKGSLESMQDLGHASNSPNDELPSDTPSKFSELMISPEDVSLSLAEIPEKENKEHVSNVYDLGGDEKDVSKLVQNEEVPSNSYVECNRNVEDGLEGLPSIDHDVGGAAFVVSDFSDNLNTSSGETAESREIQTTEITSCDAEEISKEVIAEAMDSIVLQSSLPSERQGEPLKKFANDLACTTIETAVDNTICLNTFAESFTEKIFSDSAEDVILEVQATLEKQKIESKMQKVMELEELESLGICVASEVVNEAVGEAALKKEYMDNDELDMTSEIQPHVGFEVENVVNSAICEAASKLKRDYDADEPSAPKIDVETSGLYDKSNETETNNNVEAVCESVILPVEETSKDEANEVIIAEEGSKLENDHELPSDVEKPVIEDLSIVISSKDVSEPADKSVEEQTEQLIVTDDEQKIDKQAEQHFEGNVSELSAKSLKESAETENNRTTAEDVKPEEETSLEEIPTSHSLIEAETKDDTTISDSIEVKDKPKPNQVTAEDAKPEEETSLEDIPTLHSLIEAETKDDTTISDSIEVKDKPKPDQVTAEDAKPEEETSLEEIPTLHSLIEAETKDDTTISDSIEVKDKPKPDQVTAEDAKPEEETSLEEIPTLHSLIEAETKDDTTISDSIEVKNKPKPDQVTAEDAKPEEETSLEEIPTLHSLIEAETKDDTTISDSIEVKDKPKPDQVTAEDAKPEEETSLEEIPTLHSLIEAETKDDTTISDSIEVKDKPKTDQVTAEDAKPEEETSLEDIPTSHELINIERKDETAISDSSETKGKPELEQNISQTVDLDNNIEISKDKLDEPIDKEEGSAPVIPEIKLTLDKDTSNETEEETSQPSSPEIVTQHQVTLRNKDQQSSDKKDGFWRRSLILDLEDDLEFEDSISSGSYDVTSPDLSKEKKEVTPHSEDSEDFTDSEEDEIIDHDAEARLGAVGGATKQVPDHLQDEEFDWYDYEQDFDEEDDGINTFEPVFTVDGLCVSRKQEKEKPKLRSVGSHYNRAVVLDNGSGIIKLGYAGDRVPRVIQQNVSGMPQRFSMHITGMESDLRDYKKYGSQAVTKAGVMHLTHPMKAGLIENWTDIEEIWEYLLYEELGAEVGDNPVLITEVSGNPRKNREKIAEILFEHLNVPAMFLADQLPLSIYATGMTSGVCLSSGFSCTQAGVVYEGHTLAYTQQQLDIGGGDLTENLKTLLRDVRARNFTTSSGWQIVNDIKENLAFVAKDYDHDIDKYQKNDSLTQYYKLPDGQMVDIGYECMSCVEPLFQPETLMSANSTTASQQPVHKLIDTAIKRCDPELQDLCYKHIVLSGGTTLLKGFTSRLQHELHLINHRIRKIRTPEHRKHSPWIGGSILASLPSFDEQYVTVDDYSENGSQIIQKKCF